MVKSKRMLKQKAVKKAPLSKTAVRTINDKYYGAEPTAVVTDTAGLTSALNWYNYMYENDKARDFLLEYMKKQEFSKADISAARRVPKYDIPSTVGWLARIQMNGNPLQKKDFFESRLAQIIKQGHAIKETVTTEKPTAVVSIQDRTAAKNLNLYNDAEIEVMDNRGSMYNFLVSKEVTPSAASLFVTKFKPFYDEIMLDDEQVAEAYGKKLKAEREFWQGVMDDLDRYLNNKKVTKARQPRAKKTKSAVDVVSKLKFQKDFPPLKIVSVNPAELVGSNQVWVFNTKYRKLSLYNAMGPAGMTVKGTTLTGFDPETSGTKGVRKPEDITRQVLTAGKIQLRRIFPDLKTNETKPNGRINSDTILLRVIK